jgi:hypothetical protein
MDSERFDAALRAWTAGTPRRTVLGLVAGSLVGLAALDASMARGKKKRRRKKPKKPVSPPVSPPPPPPPPPAAPTCSDGIQNGAETDVDCGGGSCDKCFNGKICIQTDDCFSNRCVAGKCRDCTADPQCPGDCGCGFNGLCYARASLRKDGVSCTLCPPRTALCDIREELGLTFCFAHCGETFP